MSKKYGEWQSYSLKSLRTSTFHCLSVCNVFTTGKPDDTKP